MTLIKQQLMIMVKIIKKLTCGRLGDHKPRNWLMERCFFIMWEKRCVIFEKKLIKFRVIRIYYGYFLLFMI